jgi:hypothetical protein
MGEEREKRLGAIELEEGADTAQSYGCGGLGGGVIELSGGLQGSGYRRLQNATLPR